MKKLILLLLYNYCIITSAQNVQLLYDFGVNRSSAVTPKKHNFFTITYEVNKFDSIGYTYFYTDVFFNNTNKSAGLGYTEISRNLKIKKFPVQLHVEFNGGLYIDKPSNNLNFSSGIHNAWLAGLSYPITFKNGAYFETILLYKYFKDALKGPDGQITFVWYFPMFKEKIAFAGIFDIWSEEKAITDADITPFKKHPVIYSEPQIWYNVNKHLSIGSEVRFAYNFVYNSKMLEIFPCVGAKYNFE